LNANKPVIKQKLWKTYVYYIEELELLLELDANKPVIKQKNWKKNIYYKEERCVFKKGCNSKTLCGH
jgi:hypothetical protein